MKIQYQDDESIIKSRNVLLPHNVKLVNTETFIFIFHCHKYVVLRLIIYFKTFVKNKNVEKRVNYEIEIPQSITNNS